MADTPIVPDEAPKATPPSEAKPTAQNNSADSKPLPEDSKQK